MDTGFLRGNRKALELNSSNIAKPASVLNHRVVFLEKI